MCGIALILSGLRLDLSSLISDFTNPTPLSGKTLSYVDDIEATLLRRGPDSLGRKKVFLHSKLSSSANEQHIPCLIKGEEATKRGIGHCNNICEVSGEPFERESGFVISKSVAELIGATLQLRGTSPIVQPLVDTYGNILVYNGEIFGGIHVSSDANDAEILMKSLEKCCSCNSHLHTKTCKHSGRVHSNVPELLSTIKGPWALIYWQASSKTFWFGRDAFGRRSLLVHWPTLEDSRLLLSSVSPPSFSGMSPDFGDESGSSKLNYWEELSCGVYSISIVPSEVNAFLIGEVKKHEWTNPMLKELILWERVSVEPKPEELYRAQIKIPCWQHEKHAASSIKMLPELGPVQVSSLLPSQKLLIALRESVMRRASINTIFQAVTSDNRQEGLVPVAVLFSGGLDSMILAALLDECLDPLYEIDLLNVSFDGQSAPDRISARAGLSELKRIAPSRRWKLVEIDAELSKLTWETTHVASLINPAKTYMDLNIGIALWLAAGGDGWVSEEICNDDDEKYQRVKYKSEAKILLVGSGADEQCAGYGRHKTKYRQGSWLGLHEEMKLDMQRIWKRNLGRDDRCIADNGKEARFPFLDEDVIRMLLDVPLWEIADLDQPSGKGDKKILREVAQLLGLCEVAVLPKRAIQFGSRIARESNRKNFGSNRAANQASAGSAAIYRPSHTA